MAYPHLQTSLEEEIEIFDRIKRDNMDRLGSLVKSIETNKTWEIVGYIVAEVQIRSAPRYTPGSGPPSARIGIMPSHDKDGVIYDKTFMDGSLVYIAGPKDKPALRMAVRVQNIRDHVSAHTLEEFEELRAFNREKERRRALRDSGYQVQGSRVTEASKSRGRPKKRAQNEEDDGEGAKRMIKAMRKSEALEDGRPGSSSSSAVQRGLTDVSSESAFEDDDAAIAIAQQLRGSPQVRIPTPSVNSPPASPRAVQLFKKTSVIRRSQTGTRSSSRQTPRKDSTNNTDSECRPKRGSKVRAVAAISSIEASNTYEKLVEKKSRAGKKMSEIETSNFYDASRISSKTGKTSKKTVRKAAPAEEDENEESDDTYAVDDILTHEIRTEKGKKVKYYLIKWVGDWDNSWEPVANIGTGAIESYEEKLRKIGRSAEYDDDEDEDADEEHDLSQQIKDELRAAENEAAMNGNKNGRRKSVVYDDDDDEEDDEL